MKNFTYIIYFFFFSLLSPAIREQLEPFVSLQELHSLYTEEQVALNFINGPEARALFERKRKILERHRIFIQDLKPNDFLKIQNSFHKYIANRIPNINLLSQDSKDIIMSELFCVITSFIQEFSDLKRQEQRERETRVSGSKHPNQAAVNALLGLPDAQQNALLSHLKEEPLDSFYL